MIPSTGSSCATGFMKVGHVCQPCDTRGSDMWFVAIVAIVACTYICYLWWVVQRRAIVWDRSEIDKTWVSYDKTWVSYV